MYEKISAIRVSWYKSEATAEEHISVLVNNAKNNKCKMKVTSRHLKEEKLQAQVSYWVGTVHWNFKQQQVAIVLKCNSTSNYIWRK